MVLEWGPVFSLFSLRHHGDWGRENDLRSAPRARAIAGADLRAPPYIRMEIGSSE